MPTQAEALDDFHGLNDVIDVIAAAGLAATAVTIAFVRLA
jgi:hypothetical protein